MEDSLPTSGNEYTPSFNIEEKKEALEKAYDDFVRCQDIFHGKVEDDNKEDFINDFLKRMYERSSEYQMSRYEGPRNHDTLEKWLGLLRKRREVLESLLKGEDLDILLERIPDKIYSDEIPQIPVELLWIFITFGSEIKEKFKPPIRETLEPFLRKHGLSWKPENNSESAQWLYKYYVKPIDYECSERMGLFKNDCAEYYEKKRKENKHYQHKFEDCCKELDYKKKTEIYIQNQIDFPFNTIYPFKNFSSQYPILFEGIFENPYPTQYDIKVYLEKKRKDVMNLLKEFENRKKRLMSYFKEGAYRSSIGESIKKKFGYIYSTEKQKREQIEKIEEILGIYNERMKDGGINFYPNEWDDEYPTIMEFLAGTGGGKPLKQKKTKKYNRKRKKKSTRRRR